MTRAKTETTAPGVLLGGDPRTVLARITPGDPLGLRDLLAGRAEARHLLLDADAVHLRSLAYCARHARTCPDSARPVGWLEAQVEEVLDQWCAEEGRRAGRTEGEECSQTTGGVWAEFAGPLGLEPEQVRRACGRFNLLPDAERAAFFALVLDRREAEEYAVAAGRPLVELAREARRALEVLLRASGDGAEEAR
ncbi:MAG: hypothetical protein QGI46_00725 [Planctomycetota bacterium]|nr:hypothetical protein [Planctomycetota bacterium]